MVAHEHPGMHPPPAAAADLFQPFQENQAVVVGFKHRLPAIATGHQVIDRTRILESQRSWHGPSKDESWDIVKPFC